MSARGHEFYLLVFNSISHSFAALTCEISSWTLEDKIRIHARACNILYFTWRKTPLKYDTTCYLPMFLTVVSGLEKENEELGYIREWPILIFFQYSFFLYRKILIISPPKKINKPSRNLALQISDINILQIISSPRYKPTDCYRLVVLSCFRLLS